jgi:hypothetical protein
MDSSGNLDVTGEVLDEPGLGTPAIVRIAKPAGVFFDVGNIMTLP